MTGAGLLYHRTDFLESSGYDAPPETWDELKEMATKIRADSGVRFGFVFQGGNYEGCVVNGMEHTWTHGGEILDGERVVIDSPEAAAGLATYRSMISSGVAADAMTTYKEEEAQAAFLRGDAAFMRNWSYVYALVSDPAQSELGPPGRRLGAPDGGRPAVGSALGATNLYVNAASDKADAAFEFMRYVTAPEQQKMRAIEGARLPVLTASYEDAELLEEVPVVSLGKEALVNARPRPVSPYYSDMSLRMAEQFSRVLKGELPPEEAVGTLQRELEDIIEQGKSSSAWRPRAFGYWRPAFRWLFGWDCSSGASDPSCSADPKLPESRLRPAASCRSQSALRSAYSTSPCSAPSMRSGHDWWNVRTYFRPVFSITRREASLTAIVEATTRRTPSSAKPLRIRARDPSVP